MSEIKLDRRTFLKTVAASGATAAILSTVGIPPAFAQAPAVTSPDPEFVAGLTGSAYGKAVALATAGLGGNLNWQPGDGIKFLAPAKIPAAAKYATAFAGLGKTKLLDIYTKMNQSRQWESIGKDLSLGGKEGLYGSFHMFIGEEAMANGAMAALNPDDYITSTHRGHGDIIAKGADLLKMSYEMRQKQEGYCKGFGGSMHLTDMSKGIMGMNGIVGGGWYLAMGAALSAKVNKNGRVAVCFAGEGAANSRYFLGPLRNGMLYKLPYVAFIYNNFFNAGTPGPRVDATKYQSEIAKGLGIPCVTVDGTDVAAVYAATKQAVDWARAGNGPAVVEGLAMRWYDHSGFAGAAIGVDGAFGLPYRSDAEVKAWIGVDPIVKFGNWLADQKIATADELTKIGADTKAACAKAWEDAKKGTQVKAEDGVKNVWMNRDVEATQFFDRKGAAVVQKPQYLVELHKNMPIEF